MVLDVAHVVEQELDRSRLPPYEDVPLARVLRRESMDHRVGALPSLLEIHLELLLGIGLRRNDPGWIQLLERELWRGHVALDPAERIEVEPEESVVGRIPVLGLPRPIAPQAFWTCVDRVLEHADRRSELLPEDVLGGFIH